MILTTKSIVRRNHAPAFDCQGGKSGTFHTCRICGFMAANRPLKDAQVEHRAFVVSLWKQQTGQHISGVKVDRVLPMGVR
jgi:hypothetical protein